MKKPASNRARPVLSREDGRAVRSERTRDAVVDALLSLIDEGYLRPTAQQISARAGIAQRTVFHHFQDREDLLALAADSQVRRLLEAQRPVPVGGTLNVRLGAYVAARARLFEAITPVRRAALLSEPFSQGIAERLNWVRRRDRDEVARVFATELAGRKRADRAELLAAAAAVTTWAAWETLRSHQKLSPIMARRVVQRALRALLLEPAPGANSVRTRS
jgi:TetR/AcrR family transcriptional regulator of autoinduction and epiphytic fitness